jgi:SAM-dependent methyltransferase
MSNLKPDYYDREFFDTRSLGALESARVVAPLVCSLVHPTSVVDLGCGRGEWLGAFAENGVSRVTGFDGDYHDPATLLIDPANFVSSDLAKLTTVGATYDLAVCLEVVEHLPPTAGHNLVRALTEAAPVVLFSAAIPGQGGTNHINEQWPSYWIKIFAGYGYRMLDPIRPLIRDDTRVKPWYRQNLMLFASSPALAANDRLHAEAARPPRADLEWVHISFVVQRPDPRGMLGKASRLLPPALKRRLKSHLPAPLLRRLDPTR